MLRLHADAVDEFGADTTAHERVEFMKLDLASLQSVMDFVEEFKRKGYPLHLLICNGGIIMGKKGKNQNNESYFWYRVWQWYLRCSVSINLTPCDCRNDRRWK